MRFNWRLRMAQVVDDEAFRRTLALFERHPSLRQELMLFYPCTTLETPLTPEVGDRLLEQRMRELRQAGFASVGIDASAFGVCADLFSARGSDVECFGGHLTTMVTHSGGGPRVSRPCPSDPGFADFQRHRFQRLAATAPDFIYLEDELRLAPHNGYCCFCRHCLQRFQDGRWSDRETLVAALDRSDDAALRREWMRFVEQRLAEVARYAREGVDRIAPELDLGVMAVNADSSTYNGRWLPQALAAARSRRFRPGHGWYQDADTRGLLRKITGVARLNAQVDLTQIESQYEYDTWPCGRLDKSDQAARHEVVGALMAGCAAVTANEGVWRSAVDEVMEQRMADWERWLPAWQELASQALPLPQRGCFVPARPDHMAAVQPGERGWFETGKREDAVHFRAEQWLAHGWAQTPVEAHAALVLLPQECAAAASDEDLDRWTHGRLICDAGAAQIIAERGFTDRVGVAVVPYQPWTHEHFIADALTEPADVDTVRWHLAAESSALRPTAPGVEAFGQIRAQDGTVLGASITRYDNAVGGRVAVIGYEPWGHLLAMPAHWRRLRRLVTGLVDDFAVVLDRCRRLAPLVRIDDDGKRCAVVLINTGFDPTGPMHVNLHARPEQMHLLGPDGVRTPIALQPQADGVRVELPEGVATWSHVLLVGS